MKFDYEYGQTMLSPEEADWLKIPAKTKAELNAFEARNIAKAKEYYISKSIKLSTMLSESFICEVHKRMYWDVWKWAWTFRKSDKNIWVPYYKIWIDLKSLLQDVDYWINKTNMSEIEICIRFKHRLVAIHPFPNWNWRFSRLMCDLMYKKVFWKPWFTWWKSFKENEWRNFYIKSLKKADWMAYDDLIYFITH